MKCCWEDIHSYHSNREKNLLKTNKLKIILLSVFIGYLLNVHLSPKCLLYDRAAQGYLVRLWKVNAASGRFQIRSLCKAQFAYASQYKLKIVSLHEDEKVFQRGEEGQAKTNMPIMSLSCHG